MLSGALFTEAIVGHRLGPGVSTRAAVLGTIGRDGLEFVAIPSQYVPVMINSKTMDFVV